MDSMTWYTRTVKDASVNAVATRSGVVQSTLARQIKAGSLTAETVVAVARAYGADVLDALVACGLITKDEVRKHGIRATLRDAVDVELAAEIMRRARGREGGVLHEPLSD